MKPILFNTEMVRAILDGRKSMTRRVIKPQTVTHNGPNGQITESIDDFMTRNLKDAKLLCLDCSPYQPGDILWVRETWQRYLDGDDEKYCYKAAARNVVYTDDDDDPITWRPSIHMPREAARIFLRVTNVRVERLWDITENDAIAEGFRAGDQPGGENSSRALTARQSFMWTWQRLYDKGEYPWASNPWVWVYEFERVSEDGSSKDK